LTPCEFWQMTFGEVDVFCEAYEIREARRKQLDRLVVATLMNVNRKKNAPVIKPAEIYPLITDRKKAGDLMTKEEYTELLNRKVKWLSKN